ncbi:peptidase MA family metallohydrolase [Gordonia shandongensis]|uniref:peptidase MA family metallohydrolase n=1 Tax=Gordonia shandongensis TaxID=376351 RepID=UPI0004058946|nr:hypothetical protein [Gordonia shandongensis]
MRFTRSAASLIAAVSLMLPVAACGAGDDAAGGASDSASTTPLNPYEQQRVDGVTALLDQLSSTLRTRDEKGLDALLDGAASSRFRDRLQTIQRNLSAPTKKLTLRDFAYRVAPQKGAERMVDDDLAARLDDEGATDTWVTPVELDYALGGARSPGLDEPTVTLHQTMTFARYGDDWKVVGDGSLSPDPSQAARDHPKVDELGPWAFPGLAALDVRTLGGSSTVLSYPGAEAAASRVRKALPSAVRAVTEFWGEDWPRRTAVIATSTAEQFSTLTGTDSSETTVAAAATVFSRIDREKDEVVGQRIVLAPAARTLEAPALAVVLRHELTHVASRLATAENAPLWLSEGVPEYVGRKGTYRSLVEAAPELAAAVAGGDVPKALPADGSFSVDSEGARVAYQAAWSFAAYLGETVGDEKLRDMYAKVGAGGDTDAMNKAFADAIGRDRAAMIAGWQKWLRKQAR